MKTMISIITPSYNRAETITSAIESVVAQNFQGFEHIIVDAVSTDNTLELLKQFPHLRVFSEPDQGMYDALNKGLKLAAGEIIGFLNTDDLYAEHIFSRVAREFDDPGVMAVAGRAIVFIELPNGETKIVDSYSPEDRSLMECSTIGSNYFNAWFFRRSVFGEIGAFQAGYKIVGDRDFMFRFALNNLKYVIIDNLVYKYCMHADSLTFEKSDVTHTWSAEEHLLMTNFYLRNQNLSSLVKNLLIQLRTSVTVDMAAQSIWMWNFKRFFYYSLEGLRYNLAWPIRFFQYALIRGFKIVQTKRPWASFLR